MKNLNQKWWPMDVASLERLKKLREKASAPSNTEWLDRLISEKREIMLRRYGKSAMRGL